MKYRMKKSVFANLGKTANEGSNRKQMVRSLFPTILMNAALPFFMYLGMNNVLHQSEFLSLCATGVPPMLVSIISIVRTRRIDFLAGVVLLGIVVGLVIALVSHDPKLLLIRESFFTATFGLAFLISLLFPKPLTYYAARALATGNNLEQQRRFESKWQDSPFRTRMRVHAAIWGVGLFLEAAVRVPLVFFLPVAQFLIIAPFVQWGILGATFVVSKIPLHVLQKRLAVRVKSNTKVTETDSLLS